MCIRDSGYFKLYKSGRWAVANSDSLVVTDCHKVEVGPGILKCYANNLLKVMEENEDRWETYTYQKLPSYRVVDSVARNASFKLDNPQSIYYYFDVLTETWGSKRTTSRGFNVRPYAHIVHRDSYGQLLTPADDIAGDHQLGELVMDLPHGYQPVSYTHLTLPTTPYV